MNASPSNSPRPSRLRRLAIGCGATLLILAVALFLLIQSFDKSLPSGDPSPQADDLGHAMMAAVDVDAWHRTGAVTWDFSGRQQHLWDRQRDYSRVRWGDHEVLLNLQTREGIAKTAGEELDAEAAAPLLEKAWSFWCNDSFWLNPVAKIFDEGTSRSLINLDDVGGDGGQGLLVTYSSGGVTPGDSYLWAVGDDQLPTTWWMWTQILPLGGVKASWEGWITLETGARVATRHKIGFLDLELKEVRGAENLQALIGDEDPFAELAGGP